jgi:protein-disulfide isomerase
MSASPALRNRNPRFHTVRRILLLLLCVACAASPPPAPVAEHPARLSIAGAPTKGAHEAPVVVVEFGDFQCPVSARHLREVMPELEESYVQTGNVRYVFRDFPLSTIHPRAVAAAVAARCAGAQGKFWEMHDRLLDQQRALDEGSLSAHAEALGLDVARFEECSKKPAHQKAIAEDVAAGSAKGVRGTPTFLIGLPVAGDPESIDVVERIPGVSSYRNFAMLVDRVLRGQDPPTRRSPD